MGSPSIGAIARGGYGPLPYTAEIQDGAPPEWPAKTANEPSVGVMVQFLMNHGMVVGSIQHINRADDGTPNWYGHVVASGGHFSRRRWPDEPGEWTRIIKTDNVYPNLIHCTRWSDAHEGAGPEVPWGWWVQAPHPDDLRGWRL